MKGCEHRFAPGGYCGICEEDKRKRSLVEQRVTYAAFKQQHDLWWRTERDKLTRRGNRAYNKGLWEGLSWRNLIFYPLLKRRHT